MDNIKTKTKHVKRNIAFIQHLQIVYTILRISTWFTSWYKVVLFKILLGKGEKFLERISFK